MTQIKEVFDKMGRLVEQHWGAVNAYAQNRSQLLMEVLYEMTETLGMRVTELLVDNKEEK